MRDPVADEDRISELLWRTVKLRVFLLALAVAVLLVVWSAVLSGGQKAVAVDVEYCGKLLGLANASAAELSGRIERPAPATDVSSMCSEGGARSYLEGMRAFNAFFLREALPSSPAAAKSYSTQQALFSEYDANRKSSYNFKIQLSSEVSSGEMLVNALTVAEIIPFAVLGIAAIVIVLGFQARAYRAQLIAIVSHRRAPQSLTLARTQFFLLPALARKQNTRAIKFAALSPEGVAVWSLGAVLLLACVGLLFAFAGNVIHLTDSITHNYLSELWSVALLLGLWLAYTRRLYTDTLELQPAAGPSRTARAPGPLVRVSVAAVAFLSLLLPWTSTLSGLVLKGYFFLLPEHPISGAASSTFYPIGLKVFSELRWQLAVALLFVAVCGVEAALTRRGVGREWLHRVRVPLAVLSLFCAGNLLLYMSTLEYEAISGTSCGIHNMIFGVFSGITPGLPLDVYDPSYGFFVFLLALAFFVWSSLHSALSIQRSARKSAQEISPEVSTV